MKKLYFLPFAFLALLACEDSDTGANGSATGAGNLPTGDWYSTQPEIDEDYTYTDYYCFTSDNKVQYVSLETAPGDAYLTWYKGTYSSAGSQVTIDFPIKAEWSGESETTAPDLTTLRDESMAGDEFGYTATVSESASSLTFTMGTQGSMTMTPVATPPAFLVSLPCN